MSPRKATGKKALPKPDKMLDQIMAFNEAKGGGVIIEKRAKGYSLFREDNGRPIARLHHITSTRSPLSEGRSHRDKWEQIGDMGPLIMPLEEALIYISKDPVGVFWG